MCTYTVLTQAPPMMLCIYTSIYNNVMKNRNYFTSVGLAHARPNYYLAYDAPYILDAVT